MLLVSVVWINEVTGMIKIGYLYDDNRLLIGINKLTVKKKKKVTHTSFVSFYFSFHGLLGNFWRRER